MLSSCIKVPVGTYIKHKYNNRLYLRFFNIQIDWIKDVYDINTDIKGFSLGIPVYNLNKNYSTIA